LVASLRTENDKLRDELRELTSSARDSSVVHKLEMEVASLTEASGNYKKEMMRSKKAEQDLQEKIDSITLQLESSSSEVTFLRGYESSYK
jgi:chromosome segregation ATPase